MRIGVLGTGMVGQAIARKLVEVGHEVRMGSRRADNENLAKWVASAGDGASGGTFADAARFGELVFHCTSGVTALDALGAAGAENLNGKVLVDVTNPLIVRSTTEAPTLEYCGDDSLGERIQRAFPGARVVKTLNTVNCEVMINPGLLPGEHVIFVSGDDAGAKAETRRILGEFGWPAERVIDLGDVTTSRGTEMYLGLYSRLFLALGTAQFSISIAREPASV